MKPIEILTWQESRKLLDHLFQNGDTPAAQARGHRNLCLALLMLDAGLRVGEVVQLQVDDLWLQNEPVTSIIVRAEIAKKGIERKIPISRRLSTAVKNLSEHYWPHYSLCDTDFAFAGYYKGRPITTRAVRLLISEAGRVSLHRDIHPHILRHTFATRLMQKTSIRVVQQLLGHTCLASTQIYTHPNTDDLKKAIEAIDE